MSKIFSWKLFEAFKSSLISNTLKYVKEGKEKFLKDLSLVCDKSDFPLSELEDDHFKYLPKKWALEYGKDSDLNLIKFWFDKDGKFLCVSTNSKKIDSENSNLRLDQTFSRNVEDYQVIKKVDINFVKSQENGVFIKFKPNEKRVFVIGVTFIGSDGRMYLVQNELDGSSPQNRDEFRNWGHWSWVIVDYEDLGEAYLVKTLYDEEEKIISWLKYDIRLIKDSHFAIVLDLDKLKSNKKSVSDIRKYRTDVKKDSIHFKSEKELKEININKILGKLELNPKNTVNIFKRIIGYDYGFIFMNNISSKNIGKVSKDLLQILSSEGEEQEELISDLKEYLKGIYDESITYKDIIRENFSGIIINNNDGDPVEVFIKEYLELNKLMSNYLNFLDKKNIIDIEYMLHQIGYLNNLIYNKVRGFNSEYFMKELGEYFIVENQSDDIYEYLNDIIDDRTIESIQKMNNLLRKITK